MLDLAMCKQWKEYDDNITINHSYKIPSIDWLSDVGRDVGNYTEMPKFYKK